jgi:hypothetical protein
MKSYITLIISVVRQYAVQCTVGLIIVLTVGATLVKYGVGTDQLNNILIFCASFGHLLNGVNLYAPAPSQYADLFKYSPTFALCMAPFAALPLVWAALLWNCLNAGVFIFGVVQLQRVRYPLTKQHVCMILWITLVELLTAVQNSQSNALLAGLAVLAIGAFEQEKPLQAAFCIALGLHIKLYGVLPMVLVLLYPRSVQARFYGALVLWIVALTALPLLVISPQSLANQYEYWRVLLASDYAVSYGLSVMSVVHRLSPALLSSRSAVSVLQVISLVITCLPIVVRWWQMRHHSFGQVAEVPGKQLPLLAGASLLLWMVVFNHKAESPTFIIAMTGVALWYVVSKRTLAHRMLLGLAIIGTSLSVTDLVPPNVREEIIARYSVKVLPCFVVWCVVQVNFWQSLVRIHRVRLSGERT